MPMQPRPSAETVRPSRPSVRVCMLILLRMSLKVCAAAITTRNHSTIDASLDSQYQGYALLPHLTGRSAAVRQAAWARVDLRTLSCRLRDLTLPSNRLATPPDGAQIV